MDKVGGTLGGGLPVMHTPPQLVEGRGAITKSSTSMRYAGCLMRLLCQAAKDSPAPPAADSVPFITTMPAVRMGCRSNRRQWRTNAGRTNCSCRAALPVRLRVYRHQVCPL